VFLVEDKWIMVVYYCCQKRNFAKFHIMISILQQKSLFQEGILQLRYNFGTLTNYIPTYCILHKKYDIQYIYIHVLSYRVSLCQWFKKLFIFLALNCLLKLFHIEFHAILTDKRFCTSCVRPFKPCHVRRVFWTWVFLTYFSNRIITFTKINYCFLLLLLLFRFVILFDYWSE
jgi:hypothetical protein